jgi:SAM-dependent methyltransferase
MREDGRREPEVPLDFELCKRFGAYASYETPNDPVKVDFFGDSPSAEIDRLLGRFAQSQSVVLDLGCGAGYTLCALAPKVSQIWGLDLEADLLAAARQRIETRGLENATLVQGNVSDASIGDRFPREAFDLVLSRRGPFLTPPLMDALKPDALFVVELAQDYLGLKEIFGRTPFVPKSPGDPESAVTAQNGLGLVPVSAKTYWYEEWFRDADHLARYLSAGASLSNWWLEPCPYDENRDRAALELYVRYNRTDLGVRLTGCRKVYVFRRAATQFYPAVG